MYKAGVWPGHDWVLVALEDENLRECVETFITNRILTDKNGEISGNYSTPSISAGENWKLFSLEKITWSLAISSTGSIDPLAARSLVAVTIPSTCFLCISSRSLHRKVKVGDMVVPHVKSNVWSREVGTARKGSHTSDLSFEGINLKMSGNLGPTVPENAAWNCVAKQPPEENPLTAIVSGFTESWAAVLSCWKLSVEYICCKFWEESHIQRLTQGWGSQGEM